MRNLVISIVLAIGVIGVLAGCSSNAGTSITDGKESTRTGFFIDSAVQNMDYICVGDETYTGKTSINGEFLYKEGFECSFSIGDTNLGSMIMDGEIVTPNDISSDDSFYNMLRLLQTLDVDSDPTNGIELPLEVQGIINLDRFDDEIDLYLEINNNLNTVVSKEEAISHFKDSITSQFKDSVLDTSMGVFNFKDDGTMYFTSTEGYSQRGVWEVYDVNAMSLHMDDINVSLIFPRTGVYKGDVISASDGTMILVNTFIRNKALVLSESDVSNHHFYFRGGSLNGYINFYSNGEINRVYLDENGDRVDPNGDTPYPSSGSWKISDGNIYITWWYGGYGNTELQINGVSLSPGANTCYEYHGLDSCSVISRYSSLSL